ncbi:MAG: hypothetical protein FJ031_10030 [Chloroflexi bacterium]|nr:hypothetical protein [Chloroflexota bacterium]
MKLSPFQITRYLFLFTAIILAVFGIGSLMRNGDNPTLYVFYAFAMFADAAVMVFCYYQLNRKSRLGYWLAFTILALNIILTIFDQVGVIDILFMLVNLVTLIALYLSRKEFLPA